MNIRIFSALCAFLGFLAIGCAANPGVTDLDRTEQNNTNDDTTSPDHPQVPENPPVPPQNPDPEPDPVDNFVTLSGAGDFLSHTGNLVDGQTAHTVEFFVRFTQVAETDVGQALYSFTDSLGLVSGAVQSKFLNAHSLRAIMNTGGNGIGALLEPNRWYHIAVSFWNNNGSYKVSLHLNGVRQFTGGGSSAFLAFSQSFELGRPFNVIGGKSASLNGAIDGVRISRGVRYAAGTVSVPNRKNMPADADTIAVWNFNETSGEGKYYDGVNQKLIEKKQNIIQ